MKWEGTLSAPFVIKQGVRQGGVLSTGHYKRYNNPLLIELENKFIGATIGYIRVPHVTVADDLALMSNSTSEMQDMVPTSGTFANRYVFHPTKSCILSYWEKYMKSCEPTYYMNGEEVSRVEQTKHLGITRDIHSGMDVVEKVNLGRRTAYSLMGAGLHSGNKAERVWKIMVILCGPTFHILEKKGNRKVQGVPQSQTAALPRPQEEEETDKSKQAQTEQTYEKH